jgi:hypothetical protein
MKLWRAANAHGIFACVSAEYSGAIVISLKRRFETPKMRSMTFRSRACRKLNSSFALAGLKCLLISCSKKQQKYTANFLLSAILVNGTALPDMGQVGSHIQESLHRQGSMFLV